jgi:PAS domain S-box-containing protein
VFVHTGAIASSARAGPGVSRLCLPLFDQSMTPMPRRPDSGLRPVEQSADVGGGPSRARAHPIRATHHPVRHARRLPANAMEGPPESVPDRDHLLRLLMAQTPDTGVILLDLDRRVLHWLGASERIFGLSSADMTGQLIDGLFTPEDRQLGIPQLETDNAVQSRRSEDERWHLRKDGSRIFLSGSTVALRDRDGEPVAIAKVFRDFTDRRSYVETLEHRLDERRRERAFKEVSLAALAHELRNPLGPLRHAMQMIRLACDDDVVHRPLAIVDRQMAALQRLVEDLVDAGRVATGQLTLRMEPVELNSLVAEVGAASKAEFEDKGIELIVLAPSAPITVEVDGTRLQQVLHNLLSNALRYTPRGGRVWIKNTVEPTHAVIRVQDTGVGLDAGSLPYIFDLFTRGPEAATLAPAGLGIGLSVVKQIVEQHGGALDVRSDGVGQGAEFSVRLPLEQRYPPQALP